MAKRGRKSMTFRQRVERNLEWKRLRDEKGYSYPRIANLYGVDHSTVIYALNPDFAMIKRAGMRKYQALHKQELGYYGDGKHGTVR